MAWSYRKKIKIIPGIHLNLSKSGISTTIGVKGASLTFGKSGTYLNAGIPGTGLSFRQKLSNENKNDKLNDSDFQPNEQFADNIFSADIQEITSQNLQGVKEALLMAYQQRKDLKNDLLKIQNSLRLSQIKLATSYAFIYGLISKSIPQRIKEDIKAKKETVRLVKEQIDNSCVTLEIDFDDEIKIKFQRVVNAFKKLMVSQKIWDVTSAHQQDRVVTRSAAGTVVNKREVNFGIKAIPDIKSDFEPLWFNNANGADMYFYPNFIIMYSSKTDFAVIGFGELEFNQSYVRFVETGSVPSDTKVIDKTWAKVNKNGSPDKRFQGNYQIPIVRYGEMSLRTRTGLNEEYQFSNFEYTEEFGLAFKDYQTTIKSLKK